MRQELGQLYGKRQRFTGTFVRNGRKRAYKGYGTMGDGFDETFLFKDIRDADYRKVADHLWFNMIQAFEDLFLVDGEVIEFDARVDDYVKGYERDGFDYKLSRPTKVRSIGLENDAERIEYDARVHESERTRQQAA